MKKNYTLMLSMGLLLPNIVTAVQPIHNSRPSSSNVIYLDYDGETYLDPNHYWSATTINAASFNMTDAEIEASWREVAESFIAFDVNVTTDRAVFDAASPTTRQMCIITPTNELRPSVGGIAVRGSFGFDVVCWSFLEDARVATHELGHTLGLTHDGLGSQEYHPGVGSWAPIMGNGLQDLVQWTKGEYTRSTNKQDDLAIIASELSYIADDAPDTLALAAPGSSTSLSYSGAADTGLTATTSGILGNREADIDVYRLDIPAGTYEFDVSVTPTYTVSLDTKIALYDANWQKIDSANPEGIRSAALEGIVSTDAIYLVVEGGNEGLPDITPEGWTSYGSIGSYDVTIDATRVALTTPPGSGSGYAPLVEDSSLSVTSSSAIGTVVGQVVASDVDAGSSLSYTITSGNDSGGFAINSNGEITVAGSLDDIAEGFASLTVTVTDNTGFSNDLVVLIGLDSNTAYDEGSGGDLSDNYAAPTVLTLNPGSNSIIGTTGLDDVDYITFNVPAGYKISTVRVDSHTSDSNSGLLFMAHVKDSAFANLSQGIFGNGADGESYIEDAAIYKNITNDFYELNAGDHSFSFANYYSNRHSYEISIVISPELGTEWTSQDVGGVGIAGSATVNNSGQFVVEASGADMWKKVDEFHFVYQMLSGDGQITARVDSFTNTHAWAKIGVMMRETLDYNSVHASALVSPTAVSFQKRVATNTNSSANLGTTSATPHWVRLKREGDLFTGSESPDGITWTVIASATITMPTDVYVGLATSSHNDGALTTAVFDNVEVVEDNNWFSADIGAVAAVGSATVDANGQFTVEASGADIWNNSDEFHFVHKRLKGDGEIIAQVNSLVNTNKWAKTGVMIRETLDDNSANLLTLTSPSRTTFQKRLSTGASTSSVFGQWTPAPIWLRLQRENGFFTSSQSSNGVDWTEISSANMTIASDLFVGFATTSHKDGTLTTAVYDNVWVFEEGLIAKWSFNDESGTDAADSTGNGFDGTVSNGTWDTAGALVFNGSNTSVSIPSNAFSSISDEITISMWVYGSGSQPSRDTIFFAEGATGQIINIHLPWSNRTIYWDAGNDGGGVDRIQKRSFNPAQYKNAWNHWVFTKNCNTGQMKMYLNGVLWHSGNGFTKSMTGITSAYIGSQTSGLYYDGAVDEVRLYNKELSAAEILELHEQY